MSIENGARFLRRMRDDSLLRERILHAGDGGFLQVTADAGASASAYDVVAALARELAGAPPNANTKARTDS